MRTRAMGVVMYDYAYDMRNLHPLRYLRVYYANLFPGPGCNHLMTSWPKDRSCHVMSKVQVGGTRWGLQDETTTQRVGSGHDTPPGCSALLVGKRAAWGRS